MIKIGPNQQPRWFTPTLRHHIKYVRILRRKYLRSPTENNKTRLQTAETNLGCIVTAMAIILIVKTNVSNKASNIMITVQCWCMYVDVVYRTKSNLETLTLLVLYQDLV